MLEDKLPSLEMDLLFDDRESGIFAVAKPAGTDVFQAQYLATGYPRIWEVIQEYRPLGAHSHRIDRFTSGVLMCAEGKAAGSYLKKVWSTDAVSKTYLCVMEDVRWERIEIAYPIKGALAVTEFKVLDRALGYALVSAELVEFGRTHQIRKHAKVLGSPLIGDRRFGGKCPPLGAIRAGDGQLLHAWRVDLFLPGSVDEWGVIPGEKSVRIQAPVPFDFRANFSFDWCKVSEDDSRAIETWKVWPLSDVERKEAWANLEQWGQTRGMEEFRP